MIQKRIWIGTTAALVCAAVVLCVIYRSVPVRRMSVGAHGDAPSGRQVDSVDQQALRPSTGRSGRGDPAPTYPPIDTLHFLDLPRFFAASQIPAPTIPSTGLVVAGVVNHHVLAVDLLERFAKGLRAARPDAKRIIILSPDHFHAGRAALSTHVRAYQTPSGLVPIDEEAVQYLSEHGVAVDNEGMFENEHGVGALVPFLHRAFPDLRLIPIAIRGETDDEALVRLAHTLVPLLDDETLIVVSADMSHYLKEDVALKNDEQTLRWLQALDAKAFDTATDDYVDNGSSFVVLAHTLEERHQKPRFTLFDHNISSHYAGSPDNTTSYLTGVWSVSK